MVKVHSSLPLNALCVLVADQVNRIWPDGQTIRADELFSSARMAQARLEHCFSKINNRYFFDGNAVIFDHLHGDQYAMWLYIFSHQLYLDGAPEAWPKKIFLLNKLLHGCDIFFEIELPSVFLLVHPLGTVLGRGRYQDYFIAYQRSGIGSNHDVYPNLGRHVTLRPGAAVLGKCQVGDNVTIASESLVIDRDIAANTTYFGNPRDHWTRTRTLTENIWRI